MKDVIDIISAGLTGLSLAYFYNIRTQLVLTWVIWKALSLAQRDC